ncbi:MAG: hypothetical protein KAU95_00600 [Candidatus Aenigmarchaeota archaeon]|nr:hypothetical protein [Candidatus Aenigmarchaeota archaeon]
MGEKNFDGKIESEVYTQLYIINNIIMAKLPSICMGEKNKDGGKTYIINNIKVSFCIPIGMGEKNFDGDKTYVINNITGQNSTH